MSDHHGVNSTLPESALKRRGLLIGASVAGVGVLAARPASTPQAVVAATVAPKPVETSGGYQLSAHVLRYYETARA